MTNQESHSEEVACKVFGTTSELIHNDARDRKTSWARTALMYHMGLTMKPKDVYPLFERKRSAYSRTIKRWWTLYRTRKAFKTQYDAFSLSVKQPVH